jgi:hypothetical protein
MDENSIRVLLIDDDRESFVLTRTLLSRARRGRYQLDWVRGCAAGLAAVQLGGHDA